MCIRADYYVGRDEGAEWLGSVAHDGHVLHLAIMNASNEAEYRAVVAEMLAGRNDATRPDQGWPWPWSSSADTDYSYWFFDGALYQESQDQYVVHVDDDVPWDGPEIRYPDMSSRRNLARGPRSGLE